MLKYYSFMWQIRQSLYENYGITVLQNLEKFQEFSIDTSRQKSLAIIKEKLKQDKNT